MTRTITRIFTLFLIPSFIGDPATCCVLTRPLSAQIQRKNLFSQQALADIVVNQSGLLTRESLKSSEYRGAIAAEGEKPNYVVRPGEPQTLEELFSPRCPLRPTFRLLSNGRPIYRPEDDPANFLSASRVLLQGWLVGKRIPEARFVHALITIEQAKRRVTFHDRLQ